MQERNQELVNKYYARGITASEKGEVELAIEDYTEVIKLNPDFAQAYYQRGLAYAQKGEIKLAIADYTKAIELKSDYADAYYCRSKAWLHLGEEEKAKLDMKVASNIGININTALNETLRNYDRAWKTLGNISDI